MLNKETINQVSKLVDSYENEIVDFLKKLIQFPTPNPPGNEKDLQNWLSKTFTEWGYKVDMFDIYENSDTRPNVVGILKGSGNGKSILLNGHIDVAEIPESELPHWKYDPYSGEINQGHMYGRGTADMKGGVTSMIMATEILRREGFKLKGDVVIQSVAGEERGEPGTKKCIEKGYIADFGICTEPTNQVICPVSGGLIWLWINVKGKSIHNANRWASIYPGGTADGVSAVEKGIKIMLALQELERHWGRIKSHPLLPNGMATINTGEINAGPSPAFSPDYCNIHCSLKIYPYEKVDDVVKEFRDYISLVSQTDPWLKIHPPEVLDPDLIWPSCDATASPGTNCLTDNHTAIMGEKPLVEGFVAVADNSWLNSAGIPTPLYGPGYLSEAHMKDEKIAINDLLSATKVLSATILDWCNS